jgi:hypothetical protein
MAVNTYPAFALDAATGFTFNATSSRVALPGTLGGDSLVRVHNLGPNDVVVRLGADNTVTVSLTNGIAIGAGRTEYLTLGSNTYIAGISVGSAGLMGSVCNIAVGN